ncbi:MAG: class I SAM-dependent methyltransferase [bacterium]
MPSSVYLKSGRDKSVLRRHPWIFSGAISRLNGKPQSGETVDVCTPDGAVVARGAYSGGSQITVRAWTFDPAEEVTPDLFKNRLERAVNMRRHLLAPDGACRLVNAESDGLPGVIVDRYADFLVCQFLSAGAEFWKAEIIRQLSVIMPCKGILDRSSDDAREKEGLPAADGLLAGVEPPELIEIREGGCRFLADLKKGQKTGFYLDQRENRAILAEYASGVEMLDCFCYTGAFSVRALKSGAARVTQVEASADALKLAKRNLELNELDTGKVEQIEGDAFQLLRKFRDSRKQFDLIVLDPPKFADSRGHLDRACRGYKDINLLGFKLLKPGGTLFTFSCSGHMDPDLFQKVVADAALDAGVRAQIVRHLNQPDDHPVALPFPEGTYLKGLVCRV